MVGNQIKMKIKINKKLDEMSVVSGNPGGISGFAGKVPEKKAEMIVEEEFPEEVHKKARFLQDEEGKLDEMYSTSGGKMLGAGMQHIDPTPEQENERYDMNYINKGLQNYKPNRYFIEVKKKTKKIRIKKQKK